MQRFQQLLESWAVRKVVLARHALFAKNLSYLNFIGFGVTLNRLKLPRKSITPKLASSTDPKVTEGFLHTTILRSAGEF